MALNQQVTDVAEVISKSLNGGQGAARASLGGGGTAWGWTSGLVPTVANYATPAVADGMSFHVVRVSESITPPTKVAAGGPKPAAATVSEADEALAKFAGMATANLESFLSGEGLAGAIASVLGAGCLKAYELDAISKLSAGASTPVTGADWVAAIAAAQAQILGNGGTPSVVVISHLDYAAFIADVLTTSAFSTSPDSPVGGVLGTPVHISPSAPTGFAYLFDAAGVVAAQHSSSPLIAVDSASLAHENKTRIVTDLIAGTFVTNSELVAKITAPVGALSASATAGKRK